MVFLSDPHFPHADEKVVAAALRLVKSVKPHRVVLNGDTNDFFQLSRFNTSLERLDSLQDEIDAGNDYRARVRKAAPNAVIDHNDGNHDSRIKTYVAQNARALKSLRALDPDSLFEFEENEIESHPGAGFRLRKEFIVKHGTIVRGESGATAKAEFMLAGVSGASGHTHRLATYRKAGYVNRTWTELGCMCLLTPDYAVGSPNWVQGCAVGEFSTRTAAYAVHEVPFVEATLRLGLKRF